MSTDTKPVAVGIVDKQPAALRFALHEAQQRGVELRVVHSVGALTQAAAFYVDARMCDDLRESGQKILDDAEHFMAQEPGAVINYVLSEAAPLSALKSEAAEASVLVIGVDDISWPERLLGGAIAAYLAKHSECPVVVVPEGIYIVPRTGGVVLALDGDTAAAGPLRFAFEEASGRGTSLQVLHSVPLGSSVADTDAVRANIAEVLAGWSERYPDVEVSLNFPVDDAEDACVRATKHSELVVVGRSHSHVPFGLARPLATKVLKRAHCPVAVVPAGYPGV